MKRLLAGAIALIAFSGAYALTASQVLVYVQADLEKKEASLTQGIPSELSESYEAEMSDIYGMIASSYYADDGEDMTRAELRELIKPFYVRYNDLKKDHDNYLKTKTSQYLISTAERIRVKNEVLVYQTRIVEFIEEAINASYKNYREEGHFSVTVKNTLVDITVKSPKIVSRINIDENRTSTALEIQFNATIKDTSTVNIIGSIQLEAITSESMLYLKISDLNVATSGNDEMKASIDEMVVEAKKIIDKANGKYITNPMEGGNQFNSIAQIKKQLEAWKKNPVLVPYKKLANDRFMMDINEQQFEELGLPMVEEYTSEQEQNLELQFTTTGSKIGICPKEDIGRINENDLAPGEEVCLYVKRTGNNPLQWKAYVKNPSEGIIDIMVNEYGHDFRAHVTAEGTETNITWADEKLKSTFKDGMNTYSADGSLTTKNADITIKKDGITIGNVKWDISDTARNLSWNLQLWDEYSTYIAGDTGTTRSFENSSIALPTNTISVDEITPEYSYDESEYDYEDDMDHTYDEEYDYENVSGTLSQKDTRQLLLKNHVKAFGESDIALVVFTDIECPFCQRFAHTLANELPELADFELHINHFPLAFHENAKTWAIESECIAKKYGEESFFSYLEERMIVGVTGDYLAGNFDITKEDMKTCSKSGTIANIFERDAVFAEKYDVVGTPSTIVINKKTGDYEIDS